MLYKAACSQLENRMAARIITIEASNEIKQIVPFVDPMNGVLASRAKTNRENKPNKNTDEIFPAQTPDTENRFLRHQYKEK